MKVNIVMMAHDRPRLTEQALRTLYDNTPEGIFNLTLIDDGSVQPQTLEVLRHMTHLYRNSGRNIALVQLRPHVGVTGKVRNLGVYWSEKVFGRWDWLYLSDNDVYFIRGWLGQLYDCMRTVETMNYKLMGGWNHPFLQPKYDGIRLTFRTTVHDHDAVAGASQLMRWSTWDAYGPLDGHAKGVGQSEDWKFCQDIIKSGGRVGSVYPRCVLNCGVTNSFGEPSTGSDVMIEELQEAKKTYPDLYWE